MEIKIKTSYKEVEIANMLLARAIEQVESRPEIRKIFGITKADVRSAARFRANLIDSFLPSQTQHEPDTRT